MKKIMVYSKHGPSKNLGDLIKENTGMLLFFTVFLCGVVFGCSLFNESQAGGYIRIITEKAISGPIEKTAVLLFAYLTVVYIISVSGALSCLGIGTLCIPPAVTGIMYSLAASALISKDGAKGLGYFSLLILPGAVVLVCAIIGLCSESSKISKNLALTNFFGRREETDIKKYLIKSVVAFASMMCSVLIVYLTSKIFSKLF